jgi:hypothetical protein
LSARRLFDVKKYYWGGDMKGFIFRMATGIKDFGERAKLRFLVALGINARDFVLKHMTVKAGKIC